MPMGICSATYAPIGSYYLFSRKEFSGKTATSPENKPTYEELEKEVRQLKKELGYVEEINRVLKKSTAIFSNKEMGGLR